MQTPPSGAQVPVMETPQQKQHRQLLSRHVQVQLRPSGVDNSRSSTGLYSVDTSKCSRGLCMQISQGAAKASVFRQDQVQLRPLLRIDTSRSCSGLFSVYTSRCNSEICVQHVHVQIRSQWCRHLKKQHLVLLSVQVQVQLKPCGVDRSRSNTGICSVDTTDVNMSRSSTGFCVTCDNSEAKTNKCFDKRNFAIPKL